MRVAALYDIHGNLPALEAVLNGIRRAGIERIVIGGDVVPGPMPRETLACLRSLEIPVDFIHGNGDREVLARMAGIETRAVPERFRRIVEWTAAQLAAEDRQQLASWPQTLRLAIPGLGDVLFCHATPRNDTEIFTRLTPEDRLRPVFDDAGVPLVVCGHTHMQFDRMVGSTRVVNAGSVGMPFGEPGAYWLQLGPAALLMRTPYDVGEAARRIRAGPYPDAEGFAATNVLNPPSESEMMARFAGAELT